MVDRKFHRPSLKMLGTFEVAARLSSFKLAAEELNVTPGAVSHQIRALETELNIALFLRHARLVELTNEGRQLFDAVSRGLVTIDGTLRDLRSSYAVNTVLIGATTAVSSLWLTPRFSQFWQAHGDIQITQEVRDRPFAKPIEQDLIIEYAVNKPKGSVGSLFEDDLIPMCSPKFDGGNLSTLVDLASAPLIHMDAKETNWTSWPNWFATLGYQGELASRHRVNNYAIALQLAQDGLGIVLGWKYLVKPLLDAGRLVPLTEFSIPAPGKFYLIQNNVNRKANAGVVRDWLLQINK